jgi:hypothetical protein
MIDLAVELAGYGGELPERHSGPSVADRATAVGGYAAGGFIAGPGPGGGGRLVPLADLQAQGFNTTPPPGFGPDTVSHRKWLQRIQQWPNPFLPTTRQLTDRNVIGERNP